MRDLFGIKLRSKHFFYFIFFIPGLLLAQSEVIVKTSIIEQDLYHTQITIDSISGNKQFINILKFPNNISDNLVELNSEIGLRKLDQTSTTAMNHNAITVVNGSFYNMKTGDLVTYFEKNDNIIYRTVSDSIRRSQSDYFLDGA